MGSTHNLQVEVPDFRRTVSFFGKLKLQLEQGSQICNSFMVHNGDETTMSTQSCKYHEIATQEGKNNARFCFQQIRWGVRLIMSEFEAKLAVP